MNIKDIAGCILLNNICNSNCKYCYENNIGDEIVSLKQVNRFKEFLNDIGCQKHITLFGGEPGINLDILYDIINTEDDFTYSMISNGSFILDNRNLSFLHKVKLNISIEGTNKVYKILRKDFASIKEFVDKFYSRGFKDITFNISFNKFIFDDIDELIDNANYIYSKGYKIHVYTIKGNSFIEEKDLKLIKEKLLIIRERNLNLFLDIIRYNKDYLLFEGHGVQYLCGYDNKITLNSDGYNIIICAMDKSVIHNVESKEDLFKKYSESLAINHRSFFPCDSCNVELGYCGISCRPYLEKFKYSDMSELQLNCKIQFLLYDLYTTEHILQFSNEKLEEMKEDMEELTNGKN